MGPGVPTWSKVLDYGHCFRDDGEECTELKSLILTLYFQKSKTGYFEEGKKRFRRIGYVRQQYTFVQVVRCTTPGSKFT